MNKSANVEGSGTGGTGGVPPPPPEGGVRTGGGGGASPPPGGVEPPGNDGEFDPPVGVNPSGVVVLDIARGVMGGVGIATGGTICAVCTGGRSPQSTWKRFTISAGEKRGRSGSRVDG